MKEARAPLLPPPSPGTPGAAAPPAAPPPLRWPALAVALIAWAAAGWQLTLWNKALFSKVPQSTALALTCQATVAALGISGLKRAGVVVADGLECRKSLSFSPAALAYIGLYGANIKVGQHVSAETLMVAGSSVPLVTALLEPLLLGRQLPDLGGLASLAGIAGGVSMYAGVFQGVHVDSTGGMWLAAWYAAAVANLLVTKIVITRVRMTAFGRTLYQNMLTAPVFAAAMLLDGSVGTVASGPWDAIACGYLACGCVMSLVLGLASFHLRDIVSATAFAVCGSFSEVVTVAARCLLWDPHATTTREVASIALALAACASYRQAALRDPGEGYGLSLKGWAAGVSGAVDGAAPRRALGAALLLAAIGLFLSLDILAAAGAWPLPPVSDEIPPPPVAVDGSALVGAGGGFVAPMHVDGGGMAARAGDGGRSWVEKHAHALARREGRGRGARE